MDGRKQRGDSRWALWRHTASRSAGLFLIGFVLNLLPNWDWEHVRIMGVLQRIGLCYLLGAAVYLFCGVRGQAIVAGGLILGYWVAMTRIPVPGYGPGHLEKVGNLAQWIDSQALAGHMWAPAKFWDPEGLLSTLPATANVLLGALAGALWRSQNVYGIAGLGGLMTVSALFWDQSFPINKPLWTSSYVLLTCGLASLVFYALWWVVDVHGWTRWSQPVEALGRNALASFVGSGLVARLLAHTGAQAWIMREILAPLAQPVDASLIYALALASLFILLCVWLDRRRIYLRL